MARAPAAGRQKRRADAFAAQQERAEAEAGVSYEIQRWPALDRERRPKRRKE